MIRAGPMTRRFSPLPAFLAGLVTACDGSPPSNPADAPAVPEAAETEAWSAAYAQFLVDEYPQAQLLIRDMVSDFSESNDFAADFVREWGPEARGKWLRPKRASGGYLLHPDDLVPGSSRRARAMDGVAAYLRSAAAGEDPSPGLLNEMRNMRHRLLAGESMPARPQTGK